MYWLRSVVVVVSLGACAHDAGKSAKPAEPPHPVAPPGPSAARDEPEGVQRQRGTTDSSPHDAQHGGQGYAMDFSQAERFARHFDDPARDEWQRPRLVVEYLQVAQGHTVADIGAGTGYFVPHLAEAVGAGGRVLALDVEPNMVAYMERRIEQAGLQNVTARQVSESDPGLSEASIDRVLIVNTWHHIGDREHYAAKLAGALKPKGSVLIVDFTRESDMGPPPQHRLEAKQVIEELHAAGLAAEQIEAEALPKQYLVRGTRTN